MKFQEIVSPSLKDLFVKQVETMILQNQLKIGEKLPNERELAKQMKVSRSIINNGMQELADKAFIKVIPRQGAYVEDYIRNGNINTLVAIIRNQGVNFDQHMLKSFVLFRRDLEPLCARNAAKQRTQDQLRQLEKQLESLKEKANTDQFIHEAIDFHKQIFIATDNLVYPLVYNAFYEVLYVITETLLTLLDHHAVIQNLEGVYAAIKEKDQEEAHRIMLHHVDLCAGILEKHFTSPSK